MPALLPPLFLMVKVKVTISPTGGSLCDQSILSIMRSGPRGVRVVTFSLLVSSLSVILLVKSTKALMACSPAVAVQVKV